MGFSSWSNDAYAARATIRKDAGTDAFDYHRDVSSGKATGVHDDLNPKNFAIRESRDSVDHPESNAVVVMFDETGSMGSIPRLLQEKLPDLMGLLLSKGYIDDPQILFGCFGDSRCDKAPLQVGQFESGIEMDDTFSKMYLEGFGGGQDTESYALMAYFMSQVCSMDCLEKRGKKGYFFFCGDERSWPVTRDELTKFTSLSSQEDISVEDAFAALEEKFEVFCLVPKATGYHGRNADYWRNILNPERVLVIDNMQEVTETIGATIGMMEGKTDLETLDSDLSGASTAIVKSVKSALDPLSKSLVRQGTSTNLPAETNTSSDVVRF